jgi:hypothetical protein
MITENLQWTAFWAKERKDNQKYKPTKSFR